MGTLDDATLAERAREADLRAFETLVRRHQGRMFTVAYRMLGDRGHAEDAVQESFLAAWRGIGAFRSDAAFSSWMYRIVTNRCLNAARTVRPVMPIDAAGAALARVGPDHPERVAELRGQLVALRTAVAQLPSDQRVCWVLRESEGLGYVEIAEIVGASPGAVRGRIHRARQRLVERMRPWQ